ncbi:AGC family protein kinase [Mycena kentingensis (nom. inval.)]|nr:AGC family protein kinase [Mycena kentingensis (nom. inval.)]
MSLNHTFSDSIRKRFRPIPRRRSSLRVSCPSSNPDVPSSPTPSMIVPRTPSPTIRPDSEGAANIRIIHTGDPEVLRARPPLDVETVHAYQALMHDIDPELVQLQRIRQDQYGTVYRALHRGMDTWVAVKVVNCSNAEKQNEYGSRDERAPVKDFTLHLQLNHPHIVRLLRVHRSTVTTLTSASIPPSSFPVVAHIPQTSWPNGFTAKASANSSTAKSPTATASARRGIRNIAHQLTSALAYLHEEAIILRNLCPAHVLLTPPHSLYPFVKLCGFGSAVAVAATTATECAWTPCQVDMGYVAPELVDGKCAPYDTKVDSWSLGILVAEITLLSLPYVPDRDSGRTFPEAHPPVVDWDRFQEEGTTSKAQLDFLWVVLQAEPQYRFDSAELLRHIWFDGYEPLHMKAI